MLRTIVPILTVTALMALPSPVLDAQQPQAEPFAAGGIPAVALPDPPVVYDTAEQHAIRVSVVADGLTYPWGLAFLPDGSMLVTERLGTVRLIRDGALDPTPVAGVPDVFIAALSGLMDVAVHPAFSQNGWVYLTYSKPTDSGSTVALARGRLDGHALTDVRDVFVADAGGGAAGAARLRFAPDGTLFMTVGGAFGGDVPCAVETQRRLGSRLRNHRRRLPEAQPRVARSEGRDEGRHIFAPFHPTEPLRRFEHPGGHPAQHHRPTAPTLHIPFHMAGAAEQTLNGIRGGERSLEALRQPQAEHGQGVVESFPHAGGCTRVVGSKRRARSCSRRVAVLTWRFV